MIDRQYKAPDYICSKYGHSVFIEAVTVKPTQGNAGSEISPDTERDSDQLANYAAIKFGSALYSKLTKRYWQLDHVKDKPLIFAIADFHQQRSMLWMHPYLMEYLYGWKERLIKTGQGLQRVTEPITEHVYHNKRIPSGYFFNQNPKMSVLFSSVTVEQSQSLIEWESWPGLVIRGLE